ncbi:hypothetical protein HNY73_010565 [Argiope bruennichi]|uniref:Uncharacterized protein n=1 Tax=Argiope bruennichi TaxID=94029 RepID=A0A8T0F6C1_ARGBR|nr:hypothetical protein HNY73_010565 [Argiope bruennichi]
MKSSQRGQKQRADKTPCETTSLRARTESTAEKTSQRVYIAKQRGETSHNLESDERQGQSAKRIQPGKSLAPCRKAHNDKRRSRNRANEKRCVRYTSSKKVHGTCSCKENTPCEAEMLEVTVSSFKMRNVKGVRRRKISEALSALPRPP